MVYVMGDRGMMKSIVAAVTAFWFTSIAAQTCDVIAAQFFKQVQQEKYSEAVDQAFATNPYSARTLDAITQLKSQFLATTAAIGKYRGNEQVLKKTVSDRYTYLYFFVAFDRQPLKIEFHCYRPTDKWVLQNLQFSDKVGADIAAAAAVELFSEHN
jgi:hypothetical protein